MCKPVNHNPKYVAEAAERGAVIVGAGRNASYRTYKLDCGHEQDIHVTPMRSGKFRCQTCLENKLHADAAEQGAVIVCASRDKGYRKYKLDCGHEQKVGVNKMRIGGFRCRTCLENKHVAEAADQGAEITGAESNARRHIYRLE